MIITCDNCNTSYNVKDNFIKKPAMKARCAKCKQVFIVNKSSLNESSAPIVKNTVSTKPVNIEGIDTEDKSRSAKVIAISNQKGGVAKTTTALNLSVSLSMLNKRVLVIDFDIQSNLTLIMGYKDKKSFFDVIESGEDNAGISEYIIKTKMNLWMLPSNSKMALLSKKHLQSERFEYLLRDKLSGIKKYFDYIIIDTPPSGDFYTLNALLASDMAVIPTPCEYLAMQGVNHIVNMINVIKEKSDHQISYKVVVTLYEEDNTAAKVIFKKLKEEYSGHLLTTIIDKDMKVQESQIVHKPTIYYDKDSKAGRQYYNLAKEISTLSDGSA